MSFAPERCPVDPELEGELPGLRLWQLAMVGRPGKTTDGLRHRLRLLSDRFTGAKAVALRQQPVPHAYRVLFRHVGLDPDQVRTPVERAALDRLGHGNFRSRSLVEDALLVALVETGVPVWALDDAKLHGDLVLRLARVDDDFVPAGRLAVADERRAVVELFGPVAPDVAVARETQRLRLFSVAPAGVPAIHVEEAMESAAEAIDEGLEPV